MNFERTNTKISLLEDYYSHFDEDKRLKSRHGQVEFITSMKYIEECLNEDFHKRILDIGAGTGAYSVYLSTSGNSFPSIRQEPSFGPWKGSLFLQQMATLAQTLLR